MSRPYDTPALSLSPDDVAHLREALRHSMREVAIALDALHRRNPGALACEGFRLHLERSTHLLARLDGRRDKKGGS